MRSRAAAKSNAARARAARRRRNRNQLVCPIEVELRVRETLIDGGWLSPELGNDRAALGKVIKRLLDEWEATARKETVTRDVLARTNRL